MTELILATATVTAAAFAAAILTAAILTVTILTAVAVVYWLVRRDDVELFVPE